MITHIPNLKIYNINYNNTYINIILLYNTRNNLLCNLHIDKKIIVTIYNFTVPNRKYKQIPN